MTLPLTNALAMRTAAISARWEDHVADNSPKYLTDWQRGLVAGQQAMRAAILALPLQADHAALLAEAVRLPEIAAIIEAAWCKGRDAAATAAHTAKPLSLAQLDAIGGLTPPATLSALETP